MNRLVQKHPATILAILLFAVVFSSCSKSKDDDGPSSSYPQEVTIEYRVTTTTSAINNSDVKFTNETGGLSIVDAAALPWSKKIKRTVNKNEVLGLSITTSVGGSVKTEILVNDKVVKTETFTGTSFVYGITQYQFN